jgi:hypothetical protein
MLSYLSIHMQSFTLQIFIEYLLSILHCSRYWRYARGVSDYSNSLRILNPYFGQADNLHVSWLIVTTTPRCKFDLISPL